MTVLAAFWSQSALSQVSCKIGPCMVLLCLSSRLSSIWVDYLLCWLLQLWLVAGH